MGSTRTAVPTRAATGHATLQRSRTVLAAVALLTIGCTAAACGPQPSTPEGPHPRLLSARLLDGAFELTWAPSVDGLSHGYELQYMTSTTPWTTFASTTDSTVVFDEVEPKVLFSFRVRDRVDGQPWSPQITARYVEPELPVIRIDTTNAAPILDRENYVRAAMTLDPNGSEFAPYSGTLDIRGRGNSTWLAPKKPYRLRLDTKAALMGIASNRHWVLLANWSDKSQLRSYAAGEVARSTDLSFTPQYRHVEVILNGSYQGVYQLTEQIRSGGDRVDIEEMGPEDNAGIELTGGYLMEIDSRLEINNEPGFRTSRNVPVVIKEPDPMTTEQRNYIRGHINTFEAALFGPSYTDPTLGYRPYLDVEAYIDHYLVHELARNQDTFYSSTFLSKERGDDRLVFGPMWDFDLSMGSFDHPRTLEATGWQHRDLGPYTARLMTDPAFAAQVVERWNALAADIAGLPAELEALGDSLQPVIANDAARWGYQLREDQQPSYIATWLGTRASWMSTTLGGAGS